MKRFLVIQTAYTGDVVLMLPVIDVLKKRYPEAVVDVLVRKGNEELLKAYPGPGRVLVFDKRKNKWLNLCRLVRTLRKERYDAVYNLQRFFSSGLIMALVRTGERVCFDKNPLAFLAIRKVPHRIPDIRESRPLHEVQRNLSLLGPVPAKAPKPVLPLPPGSVERVKEFTERGPYFVVAPASVWFTKQWPQNKWRQLLERLPAKCPVYLIGSASEKDFAESLVSAHPRAENLCGRLSLPESAALMRYALRVFCNDSAPLHLASAVNAPVSAVFCSTVTDFGFYPLSDDHRIAETRETLVCRPCGLHGHTSCPQKHFRCALSIDPIQLFPATLWLKAAKTRYQPGEIKAEVLSQIKKGGVLLHNTDTIPGLAARASDTAAIDRIVEIKNRPPEKGMILLCENIQQVKRYVRQIPELAFRLWDLAGDTPVTLVMPAARNLDSRLTGPDGSVAIRVVRQEQLQEILRAAGEAVVSTSANKSGEAPPDQLSAVDPEILETVDFILEDEIPAAGQPSTVIRIEEKGFSVLREGAITPALKEFLQGGQ